MTAFEMLNPFIDRMISALWTVILPCAPISVRLFLYHKHKIKNNMKNVLMNINDKILIRKRAVIETVNDELKNIAQIEHSRHRSFNNFIANALSAIAAYCFFDKKPAIEVEFVNDGQLTLF